MKEDLAKVGTGVYRSARQNALRLTITETNMAYNYSNCSRWADEPFVLGVRIRLSEAHPEDDICDTLEGDYPKTFMWRGWHPRCMCSISPILMDRSNEEWKKLRAMSDEDYKKYQSPNLIKNVPKDFKDWCDKNKDKLDAARERGKLPYFVRDNEKVVGEIVGWEEQNLKHGYKGRAAKNEAYEVYKSDKPTIITEEQRKNILEIAKIMGIKERDVKPMSFNEADNGQPNIYYHKGFGYKDNCQSCVVVFEARLRGLNIITKEYSDDHNGAFYKLGEKFQKAWIDPKTRDYKEPSVIKNKSNWLKEVENKTKAEGRYHIGINDKVGGGHVIVAERIKGKLVLYDPQSNTFDNINSYNFKSIEILRVDNLLINVDFISRISEIV